LEWVVVPLFFVPLVGLVGIGIALIRRHARVDPDVPAEDAAARLAGWAVGLLSPERAQRARVRLEELGQVDGRTRRWWLAVRCVGAALVSRPRGRAAVGVGVGVLIALAVGSVGVCAGATVQYRLGGGDWLTAAILTGFVIGCLLVSPA
jgi:hypothetical protein